MNIDLNELGEMSLGLIRQNQERNIASLTGLIVGDQAETEEIAGKSKIAATESSKTEVRKMKNT